MSVTNHSHFLLNPDRNYWKFTAIRSKIL
jgi:hypothetical protein